MKKEQQNPWETLDISKAYENPWIRVTHEEVVTPGGTKGIYGKVHFKNLAIAIVPLDEKRNTWLVGQYRYTLDEYSWEVPEGGGPLDAPPLASAKRELLEETGLRAGKWDHLLELRMSNSVTDERGHVFLARSLEQGEAEPDDTEQLRLKKMPFRQALQWIDQGKIQDSLSINALWAVHGYLNR